MDEDLKLSQSETMDADPNALIIEELKVGDVTVKLISCDHRPDKMPESDPWQSIEEQIGASSLVYVEYFPTELERTIYNHPVLGKLARNEGNKSGINDFFTLVTDLCHKYGKEIAVADIANGVPYVAYMYGTRSFLGPLLVAASNGEMAVLLAGFSILAYGSGMAFSASLGMGAFDLERSEFERFILDFEDARRLLTARGIRQEAERREEGSIITYIAPRAHVSRVKWYLEHPEDLPTRLKSKFYSLFVGMPRSTRIFKYSAANNTWQLVSNIKTS